MSRRGPLMTPLVSRRRFWRSIGSGASQAEAAAAAGVSHKQGKEWFAKAGGMSPICLREPSGRYLSVAEREEIAVGIAAGESIRAIAAKLGRAASTVSRELGRNTPWSGSRRRRDRPYRAHLAQARAEERARRPKPAKLATMSRLRRQVQAGLKKKWSPEQIVRRLRRDFPDDPEMRVCHETIYQALYVQSRGALRRELTKCLRTGRVLRKPRRRSQARRARTRIIDPVMISDRPAEVADRAVPGHWEGDLIIGGDGVSAIGTLVERTTRFVILLHLPGRHTAEAVRTAIVNQITVLPAQLRRSLTWDQGTEMSQHQKISIAADLPIYFCDPHSPWQRGTNENTNGLLRQYFPKGTRLSGHSPKHLNTVANELNTRPRKTLDWDTPAERLAKLLSEPITTSGVATTN
jgi:IS30 family transposase